MPSVSSFSKKERLINGNDDDIKDGGYTEVAVVDNPLYAENEGEVDTYLKEELATEHEEDEIEVHTIIHHNWQNFIPLYDLAV